MLSCFFFILPPCLVLFYSLYFFIFCLAKPITPLCWYLALGYLPALHPIFTTYVHAFMYTWMKWYFSQSKLQVKVYLTRV